MARIVLPQPTEAQREFIDSAAKRKIVRAGRRAGKTTGSVIAAVRAFAAGKRVLYVAPTSDQTEAFWREIRLAFAEVCAAGIYRMNQSERYVEREGTANRIRCKTSWDPESLRGDFADLLILDEWQLQNENVWTYVLQPALLDHDGSAIFIYTPPSWHSQAITHAHDPRHAPKMFKNALADTSGRWKAFHFSSHSNPHLSQVALGEIAVSMTALAFQQEILAEDVEQIPGALWSQRLIDKTRIPRDQLPVMDRILIGLDPSGSATTEAGLVAAGIGKNGHRYVIADKSLLAPSPEAWASAAVRLYHELGADRIVGERNYGGDMVRGTIYTIDPNVSYKDTVSSRGKILRAEPICASFERGRAHLVGEFPELKSEMCSYAQGGPSPNRLDAMVFAMAELGESGILGVVEWFKGIFSGRIADPTLPTVAVPEVGNTPGADAPNALPAMFTGPNPAPCTACGSNLIVRCSGQLRCNTCGAQRWENGAPNFFTPNRKDFLAGKLPSTRIFRFPGQR